MTKHTPARLLAVVVTFPHANDPGLLSRQVAAGSAELLAKVPQAFNHIGLINAAHSIGAARRRAESELAS